MPTFRYESLQVAAGNGTIATTIEAPDRAAAVRALVARGITPVRVEPADRLTLSRRAADAAVTPAIAGDAVERSSSATWSRLQRTAMSRAEMASFIRELSTAVQAGLTLVQAMRTVARSGHSEAQKRMLQHLIHEVEHGKPFSEAAASWGKPFGELTVSLIRAGEASGRLGELLEQTADLLDRDAALRRAVMGALLYPMIIMCLVSVAVVVVVTVIVPSVLEPLAGKMSAADLPLPTRIVQGVATIVGSYWWLILALLGGAAFAWIRVYRDPHTGRTIDRWLVSIPVVGRLLVDAAVARFTRTLATLIGAGLPALQALRITKATLGNRHMEALVEDVATQVAGGRTIADPLEEAGVFPPLLVQIVSVGERSGRLGQLLSQAATALDARTQASIKLFSTVLPPILIMILACVIGLIMLAIMLPLLEMQEYIK